ncbi:T9SS type A sorting domain-containing protein [Aureispira sp. CCB-E]|uniref:T9SS type A sorting domain-containing protein n=1 Tax=Aureispira sp. CCB-E TaxID=3051121 RepID=UPI0028692287|nr:T9SS type A sorting domain-containing protein [Aureispira sp. CCB-E]WMX12166.1 T9SS type A sorting domain-containing protein [Aureispira sp. CCB-E]
MKHLFLCLCFAFLYNNIVEAQVPRKIFVEHFTNTLCSHCANRNPGFYTNLNNQNEAIHISIHSGVPYTQCLLYQQNASPSDARRFYYGILGTPALIINGFSIPLNSDYSQASIFAPFQSQTSPIRIRMEQQKYGDDSMRVRVIVKTEASHNLGTEQLWVGLAEDSVFYMGPNGEAEHYDVYRASLGFLPINIPSTVGDSLVYDYTAFANVNWDFSRIFAFAMIQNTNNKSVTQSESTQPNTNNLTTGIRTIKPQNELRNVLLYPNPTQNKLNIVVEEQEETTVVLYNNLGQAMVQERFRENVTLPLGELPKGIYWLYLNNPKGVKSEKIVLE